MWLFQITPISYHEHCYFRIIKAEFTNVSKLVFLYTMNIAYSVLIRSIQSIHTSDSRFTHFPIMIIAYSVHIPQEMTIKR